MDGSLEIDEQTLAALACEIGARPAEAPHFGAIEGAVRAVRREPGALVVEYDTSVAETLEAVVEAERVCCAGISWEVERTVADGEGEVVRLRVRAVDEQLEVLAPLFAGSVAGRTVS